MIATFSEEILDDKQEKEGTAKSIPNKESWPSKRLSSVSAQAQRRSPVCLTKEIGENQWPSISEVQEEKLRSVAVEPSSNLSAEKHPLICMRAPQQGVVTPVHPSPTILQQLNHQPCSSGGLTSVISGSSQNFISMPGMMWIGYPTILAIHTFPLNSCFKQATAAKSGPSTQMHPPLASEF